MNYIEVDKEAVIAEYIQNLTKNDPFKAAREYISNLSKQIMKTCIKSDTIRKLKEQIGNVSEFINEKEDELKQARKSLEGFEKDLEYEQNN